MWLRLHILLPLLPCVYADQEACPTRNLRVLLATALVLLLGSPLIRAQPKNHPGDLVLANQDAPEKGRLGVRATTITAASARSIGSVLWEELLDMLVGVIGGVWTTWLRGNQVLHDVFAASLILFIVIF